jgi:hypothetical protein
MGLETHPGLILFLFSTLLMFIYIQIMCTIRERPRTRRTTTTITPSHYGSGSTGRSRRRPRLETQMLSSCRYILFCSFFFYSTNNYLQIDFVYGHHHTRRQPRWPPPRLNKVFFDVSFFDSTNYIFLFL